MLSVSAVTSHKIDLTPKLWSGEADAAISRQCGGRAPASTREAQCSRNLTRAMRAYEP